MSARADINSLLHARPSDDRQRPSTRGVPLRLVCVAWLTIAGLLACDTEPSRLRGLPSPTQPGSVIVRFEIGGPAAVAPGTSVQLTAIVHMGDGSSRDVTADGFWNSSNSRVVSVAAGRATGHQMGEAIISVNYGGGRGTRELIVVPQDTFRITGLVTETEPPSRPRGRCHRGRGRRSE